MQQCAHARRVLHLLLLGVGCEGLQGACKLPVVRGRMVNDVNKKDRSLCVREEMICTQDAVLAAAKERMRGAPGYGQACGVWELVNACTEVK